MPRSKFAYVILLSALSVTAFGQGRPPSPCPTPPAAGQPAYKEITVTDPGSLTGRVSFKGQYAPMKWKVIKDRDCCGDTVIDESLVASPQGGLQYVVVSIDDIREGKALPYAIKEVANKQCRYQPHVEVLTLCDKLMITNRDPILHNTHAYIGPSIYEPVKPEKTKDGLWVVSEQQYAQGPATAQGPMVAFTTLFNLGLPTQDFMPKKTMREPGLITLKCDAGHTWMTGYVWVKPHPYAAVTGPDGEFLITDIPAGEYTVTFWHEALGVQQQKVTINKGEKTTVNVTYTLK
ncbi:MAG TPA: carboxypeptidase regulatory-like domain-containing protein [bacterium]|nr:carboxypeptidase regulatory-like domain-containing protein [bacterium]